MTSIAQIKSTRVNGLEVDKLLQTIDVIRGDSTLARFQFRIDNQWLGAGRSRAMVRTFFGAGQQHAHATPFELQADEPPVLLGTDSAANAGEILLQALAACVTGAIVYHAAARGISIQAIESAVEGDIDLRGFLGLDPGVRNGFSGISMKLRVKADVPDAELQALCDLGPRFSPVYDCLTKGLPVSVSAQAMR